MPDFHMIRGYRNLTGNHCGSTAMRNLLQHYCDLDLSEEEVLGLGSGVHFVLVENEEFEPGVFLAGRGLTMEQDVAAALDIDYREQVTLDDDEAWELVRAEVLEDRPTMLTGDIFYLDFRDYTVHFPSHRFVLLGFDDAKRTAFVADRVDPDPQPCSYQALRESRNPSDFISTFNMWGKFFGTRVGRSREEAYADALQRSSRRMLGKDDSANDFVAALASGKRVEVSLGLQGMQKLLHQLPSWPHRKDADFVASYASRSIEKFGTGGGNFRNMYTEFMRRAHSRVPELVDNTLPELMAQSSAQWTELSSHFADLAKRGLEAADEFSRNSSQTLSRIIELETRIFESIGARTGI